MNVMSDRTVKVGLIGCGNIGVGGHLPAYAHIPEAKLVAVCDAVEELAHAAAARSGATAYTDHRQLLARGDLNVVDICLPTYLHGEVAAAAAEAGKHILCEKPMAHTLQAADTMIKAVEKAGVKLMIAHVRRFDHRYTSIKEQIDAGKIGRPVFVRRAERQFLPFPPDAWQWDPRRGGGVILDIGVHVTDLFRWLFGQEAVEVYAVAKSVRESARAANSYDHAFITCKFGGGEVGLAETSWAYPQGFGGALYAHLDVVGTEGKVQYADKDTNPMLTHSADKGHELPRFFRFMSTTEYAFEEEIHHFVLCVLDDREPAVSPQDARAALEMALAAQRSAETRQAVRLPLQKEAR
ncbi:MAG: Gfo/Idh/MocA family oxidoreductase [Chloroflexota bacterium]|nr:Gfo/Idh/MocA family oxidoreductase [Chloroflexota bacterium]